MPDLLGAILWCALAALVALAAARAWPLPVRVHDEHECWTSPPVPWHPEGRQR
jgi:hypothetical protein